MFPTDAVPLPALKNADDLLRSILRDVDTNRDGHIDYAGMDDDLSFVQVLRVASIQTLI